MKRIVIVGLMGMILFLNGCGSQEKVGICFRQNGDPLTQQLETELTERLHEAGYRVIFCYASMDQGRQHGQIRKLLQNRVDYLVIEPVMAAETETIARTASAAETPLIFLETPPNEDLLQRWDSVCYVSTRREQAGEMQRQLIGEGILESAGSLVISGPEDFLDGKSWAEDSCRGFSFVKVECGDWSRNSGRKLAGRALGMYGKELDVIFCHNPQMALGALEAAKGYDRHVGEDLQIVALGLDWPLLEAIESGQITGTVCTDPAALVEGVRQCLAGENPERIVWTEFMKKTAATE